MQTQNTFHLAFRGHFTSLLSWQQLDEFWEVVRHRANGGWYIYAIGMPAPAGESAAADVIKFITAVNTLLHADHAEDYCGIVYTDHKQTPTFIKIFDPYNLGVSCGFSNNPPLPGWIMSLIPPQTLKSRRPLPAGRQRWWHDLWV